MARPKIKKLDIEVPAYIRLLPGGTTYFNSKNSDRIPAANLYKYLTGKDPEVKPTKTKTVKKSTDLKDELIRSRRWDL